MEAERFWARVRKTEGCWDWLGRPNGSGYGSYTLGGRKMGAHCASYRIAFGPYEKGLYVLHTCDNPICVRPSHLWLGTQKDNMEDAARKGRMGACYRWTTENHPYKGGTIPERTKEAVRRTKQRPFVVKAPDGEIIHGVNLTLFCRERGLNQGAMWSVVSGNKPRHKGYTKAP